MRTEVEVDRLTNTETGVTFTKLTMSGTNVTPTFGPIPSFGAHATIEAQQNQTYHGAFADLQGLHFRTWGMIQWVIFQGAAVTTTGILRTIHLARHRKKESEELLHRMWS